MEPSAPRHLAIELLEALDLAIVTFAFIAATLIVSPHKFLLSVQLLTSSRVSLGELLLLVSMLIAWHSTFRFAGAYQSHRFSAARRAALETLKLSTASVVILYVLASLARISVAPLFFPVLWIVAAVLEVLSRLSIGLLLFGLRRRGRNLRALLIVGANERAVEFAARVSSAQELGYRIAGFVSAGEESAAACRDGVVCRIEHLARYLRESIVDEVAVCLRLPAYYDEVCAAARICEEQGIMVRIHADLFDDRFRVVRLDEFESDQLLTVTPSRVRIRSAFAKQVFDMGASLILIVLLAPAFLAAAVAVKLSSPGPIFFKQERLGQNKRRFRVLKFRTMTLDAEQRLASLESLNEAVGPVFKMKSDPRVTPAGRILRKLSIDELPQLFNVLQGNMSLVGPRPLPVRDYSGFSENWHLRRFSVRPGISCLWQISGRSEIGFHEWMELDMKYIDQWSLWLDVKILAKTIPAVLRGAGAY